MQRCLASLLLTVFLMAPAWADDWVPVKDVNLEVGEGSALDFSFLQETGPAGQHGWSLALPDGHIGFEKRRQAQRFLAASFAFSPASGGFPSKEDAQRLVQQLRRTGYNAVRLHNVDAMLMSGRDKDFDFDPEQLDRFHQLLAQLKAGGIYVVLDVMHLDNGAFGGIYPHRWVIKHKLRRDLYVDDGARAHWLKLLKEMLGRKNPYTGISPLQDPATLALILVNEGGVAELAYREGKGFDKGVPSIYEGRFREWLKRRYGSRREALRQAWRGELDDDEGVDRKVKAPATLRGASIRHQDFMRFVVELEQQTYQWMDGQVRALGFKGLTTAFNNWGFQQSDLSRSRLGIIDMHSYHTSPSALVDPGSKVEQTSALANGARVLRELTSTRQWGKPFMVSEYGQPFWNTWRREISLLVPAYASFHGWDLITQFAENPLELSYREQPYKRRKAIHPWGIGGDPVLRAGERLAALLFRRGDVGTSATKVQIALDPDRVLGESAGWAQLPDPISRIALVSASGLSIGQNIKPDPGAKSLVIDEGVTSYGWAAAWNKAASRLGVNTGGAAISELKERGLIPSGNRTDAGAEVYETTNGQLLLEAKRRRLTVKTDRTVAVALAEGEAVAGIMKVTAPSEPVLVALSSLDGKPVRSSGRLLLFVLTDAINTGMTFEDEARTTLKTLGKFPPMLRPVSLRVQLDGVDARKFKVHALALDGSRREAIKPSADAGALSLRLDTGALSKGPTTYFEIVQDATP